MHTVLFRLEFFTAVRIMFWVLVPSLGVKFDLRMPMAPNPKCHCNALLSGKCCKVN
jgi:hypothetical protein